MRSSRRKKSSLHDGLFAVCLMLFFIVLVTLGFLLVIERRHGISGRAQQAAGSSESERAAGSGPANNFGGTIEAERRAYRQKMATARANLRYLTASDLNIRSADDVGLLGEHENEQAQPIQILLWDSPHGPPFYWGQGPEISEPNNVGYLIEKAGCPVRCEWLHERRYLPAADVVLFDPTANGGPSEWRRHPPHLPEKRAGQKWLFYAQEQASLLSEPRYLQLFDGQMTSEARTSLQQITMMCPWGGFDTWLAPPPPKSEEKLVAFVSSSGCGDISTRYVEELMRHVDVHSFGLCLRNRRADELSVLDGGGGDALKAKIRLFAGYRFVLAFEKSFVADDHVSERLALAFLAGAVPVYLGAGNVEEWLPGAHSIVRADSFASPSDLATYLLELAGDRRRYDEYFAWKKHGLSPSFRSLLDNCVFNADCNLCTAVHRARSTGLWPSSSQLALLAASVRAHHSDSSLASLAGGGATPMPQQNAGTFLDASALQLNRQDLSYRTDEQYVELVEPPRQPLRLASEFTVAAWIRAGSWSGGRNFIVDNSAADGSGFSLSVLEHPDSRLHGLVEFCLGVVSCTRSSLRVPLGRWVHVALTCTEGQQLVFFVDGVAEERELADPLEILNNQVRLRFGRPTASTAHAKSWRLRQEGVFDGSIDDVVLLGRAATTLQVQSFMFSRLDILEDSLLLGYWDFNEGSGDLVHDSSANANHARIFGQPQWIPVVARPLAVLTP